MFPPPEPTASFPFRRARYLEALRAASRRTVFAGLDALSHEEGCIRIGVRSGLHVLLVEEAEGERRPLVFESL